MPTSSPPHLNLQATAKEIMLAEGFQPDIPPNISEQLSQIKVHPPALAATSPVRDLQGVLWSSIDNDTSKDLDQVEVAERLPDGGVKVMIGIAQRRRVRRQGLTDRSTRRARDDHRLYGSL